MDSPNPAGTIWLTRDALASLQACPDYQRALVAYVAVLGVAERTGAFFYTDDVEAIGWLRERHLLVLEDDGAYSLGPIVPPRPAPVTPCVYCGDPATDLDHVVPRVRGGKGKGNLVPACAPCNRAKSTHDVRQWVEGSGRDWPAVEKRLLEKGIVL